MSVAANSATGGVHAAAPLVIDVREGAIATLTMNRPEKLNALDIGLTEALSDRVRQVANDSTVRAVVITGAGRGFSAGGDLGVLRDFRERAAPKEIERLIRAGNDAVFTLATMEKPVIAAVNGPAAGAGMSIALACDIRLAGDSATFAQSFAKVGLFPDFGSTWFLPRLVGVSRAAEMFYSGALITAEEAADLGIVNRVVPNDILLDEAKTIAATFAAGPPISIRAIKKTVLSADAEGLRAALENEIWQQAQCFQSEDCAEGFAAFFEKRPPVFRGK
ncbi:MAG TPA: enoyl-CoA hydratase [Candidatus Acidoferrales bacterium]|nr:enoyl-CoA hydratase [Candidatus Acidoferrales bacterium]